MSSETSDKSRETSDVFTPEEAIALMREHAWSPPPDPESYQKAIGEILSLCEGAENISAKVIRDTISRIIAPGQSIIHAYTSSGLGADWSLESAIRFAQNASSISWRWQLLGHNLAIEAGGRTVYFDVRAPSKALQVPG